MVHRACTLSRQNSEMRQDFSACCKRTRGALSLGADSRVNGKSLTLKLTWIYGEQALRVEHYGLRKCPKLYSS
jgi:hypothetical protein